MCKDKKIMKSILLFIVLMLSLMFFATNVYAIDDAADGEETISPSGGAATEQEARETWEDALRQYYEGQGILEDVN